MAWYDRFLDRIGRAVQDLGESILEFVDEITEPDRPPRRQRQQRRRQQRAQRREPQPPQRAPEPAPSPIRYPRPPDPVLVRVVRGNAFWARPEYERSQYESRTEADDAWNRLIDAGVQPEMMAIARWANRVLPYSFYVGESP